MRRLILTCMALAMMFCYSQRADASLLTDNLSFNGITDVLDDDSVSFIVDNDSDSAISAGDYLVGVMRVGASTKNGVLPATDQLIGYFAFEILTSTGAAGPDPTVTITNKGIDPLAGSGWSIDEVFGTALGASAAIAVLSHAPDATDPTDLTPGAAIPAITPPPYGLDAVLGFGVAADYLEVQSFDDGNDNGKLDFAELPAPTPAGVWLAGESGGMSVLSGFPPGVVFLPVSSTHADGSTTTTHDVGISGSLFGLRSDTPAGWDLTDSTALAINAVPEPGSMAVWALLVGVCGLGFARRKKS